MAKKRRKSTQTNQERRLTGLNVSRDEATRQLEERILEGRDLLTIPIARAADLRAIEEKERAWGAYNVELLRRLFDSDEFADSYTRFYGMAVPMNPNLGQEVRMFQDRVNDKISRINAVIAKIPLLHEANASTSAPDINSTAHVNSKVFIVHGHDEAAKQSAARLVERLGLTPIVLHEQANQGKTIIEKLEHNAEVGYAIVLLTSDDIGGKRTTDESDQQLSPRARQNVVAELGYFVGKLGRNKVSVLHKDNVEVPSDFDGVVYTPMDSTEAWHLKLAKELRAAGYPIDLNLLA